MEAMAVDDFPIKIKTSIYGWGFSMAMLNNQMVQHVQHVQYVLFFFAHPANF